MEYMFPFILRDSALFLVFLVGMGAGVYVITQNKRKVGGLILSGFALLGLEPIADFVIFNLLSPKLGEEMGYEVFNWSYACTSGISMVLGTLILLTAFYFAIQPEQENTPSNDQVIFAPEDSTK